MARRIALGYSISYHGVPASSNRHGSYQQPELVSLNVREGAKRAVVFEILMPKISHGQPHILYGAFKAEPQASPSTEHEPNAWPMTPLA
jgi:hypothetical protein